MTHCVKAGQACECKSLTLCPRCVLIEDSCLALVPELALATSAGRWRLEPELNRAWGWVDVPQGPA